MTHGSHTVAGAAPALSWPREEPATHRFPVSPRVGHLTQTRRKACAIRSVNDRLKCRRIDEGCRRSARWRLTACQALRSLAGSRFLDCHFSVGVHASLQAIGRSTLHPSSGRIGAKTGTRSKAAAAPATVDTPRTTRPLRATREGVVRPASGWQGASQETCLETFATSTGRGVPVASQPGQRPVLSSRMPAILPRAST